MPTIDQLPAATASADTDELVVSQSGITRKVTRAQLLSGLQPEFTAGVGQLVGNSSDGSGTEGISVGGNLVLANGTLSATATAFVIEQLPAGVVPASTDLVPLSQSGSNVSIPYNEFISGMASLSSVNASHFNVTPAGSTSVIQLGQFAANTIQKSGAQMSGPLLLASDPTLPLQAATMEYVQNAASAATAGSVSQLGGTISGLLAAHGGLNLDSNITWSGGYNINQSNPQAGALNGSWNVGGAVTPAAGGTSVHELFMGDNLNVGSAGAGVNAWSFVHDVGTLAVGGRSTFTSTLTVQGPTGNAATPGIAEYGAGGFYMVCHGNDGGTAQKPSSVAYGLNTTAHLFPDCTYWGGAVGYEMDHAVDAGASVAVNFGLHVCTLATHGANGSQDDIAIHISGSGSQTAFWEVGLGFGANTKPTAFGPNSTLIKAFPTVFTPNTPLTVQCGIDFTKLTTTGNMIQTPGYALGPLGQISQTITNAGTGQVSVTPQVISYSPIADRGAGGYSGFSAQVIGGAISQNPDNSGNRFNTEFQSVQLTVQATEGDDATIGHSAVGTHVSKTLPKQANGAVYTMGTADVLPACWSLYGTAVDSSQLPTSISGPLACQEYDMQVNAIDDRGVRGGYAFNGDNIVPLTAGGYVATISQGFYSYGLNDTWIWTANRVAGNHIMSAHDSRFVNGPETTVRIASTGTTVAVVNVTPYMMGSGQQGGGLAFGGPTPNPIYNVKIGSGTYEVVNATVDGAGHRSGVLTLSSPLQGTDGAAGGAVARPFYALIMRTGDRIGFDDNGNVQMFYDSAIFGGGGGIHATANVQCNAFQANTVVATGGTSSFSAVSVSSLSASSGVNVSGGFFQPSSFAFAGLPNPSSAPTNAIIWVSNGLKPNEVSGSGTGVLACRNAAGTAWLTVGSYTAVAA